MIRLRHGRPGFTLTEILMAVGILGIGLTMVATVFPVAVDQSRQSRNSTMAALCARSVSAAMRARRDRFVRKWCRTSCMNGTAEVSYDEFGMPCDMRTYSPSYFLYDKTTGGGGGEPGVTKSYRGYPDSQAGMWLGGGFAALMFATPVDRTTGRGPWRVAIVVYRTQGEEPTHLLPWNTNRGEPGDYIIHWRGPNTPGSEGEVYLVDNVHSSVSGGAGEAIIPASAPSELKSAAGRINLAQSLVRTSMGRVTLSELNLWISLPGAVAAYHTIVGD